MSTNLNQIAKWANTYKSTAEAIEVIECLREIEKKLEVISSFPSAPRRRRTKMLVKFFKGGTGQGASPVEYLTRETDSRGVIREPWLTDKSI